MRNVLKYCPICKGKAEVRPVYCMNVVEYQVVCMECGAHNSANSRWYVIDQWNYRPHHRRDKCPLCGRGGTFRTCEGYSDDRSMRGFYGVCGRCWFSTGLYETRKEAEEAWERATRRRIL